MKHTHKAAKNEAGEPVILSQRGDEDEFNEMDLDDSAALLDFLAAISGPDDKFQQYVSAIQRGDRAEALRLLREHDEAEGWPADNVEGSGDSEEETVDKSIAAGRPV